jgi:hypothetical protein
VKLFQIEEPDGSPTDPDAPGAAIGLDASGLVAVIAFAVGGNAVILGDRDGFEHDLPIPRGGAAAEAWQALFEGAKLRAERGLARPVTHAVVALAAEPDRVLAVRLHQAAMAAGLDLLDIVARGDLAGGEAPAAAAAALAEDRAPRPEGR